MRSARSPGARLGSRTLIVATIAMALLLIVLAVLQYRWVGQVSAAERERLKRALRTSADRIADDFDREVFRAFIAFQPHRRGEEPLVDRLADGWDRWRASALQPDMVEGVYVAGPEAGAAGGDGDAAIARLDPDARALRPAEWPSELTPLEALVERAGARRFGPVPLRRPGDPVLASAPALVLPIWMTPRDRRDSAPPSPRDLSSVIVLLDRRVIAESVLPALVDLHLGVAPRDTQVWVIDRSRRDEMLYTTAPGSLPPPRQPGDDATARGLLDLRSFPELRAQGFQHVFDDPDTRRALAGAPPSGRGGPRDFRTRLSDGDTRGWMLVLAPVDGALDAAVASLRRRNLGVGLGVVALLGATSALLLFSARQAQRLARREMELVAGITHELRTPLASIASAADNLADGVVREPDQIRRYGGLIKGETHRLGVLVSQVLDFAGSAATARRARPVEPVDLDAIVDRVLDDHRFTIEEKSFVVERRAPPGGARVLAEPEALRRALDNVVGNALKYGETGRFLGIEIATAIEPGARAAERVLLRVHDRGPGIARADRRRVFEPFYRGPAAQHQHGTGLGLAVTKSVIESLGGTIDIEDGPGGRGVSFVIALRASPAETAQGGEAAPAAPRTPGDPSPDSRPAESTP